MSISPKNCLALSDLLAHSVNHQKEDDEKPNVVFFPTSQDDSAAQCQDQAAQGSGFNVFAFLSFLLSVFNAIRYVCITSD